MDSLHKLQVIVDIEKITPSVDISIIYDKQSFIITMPAEYKKVVKITVSPYNELNATFMSSWGLSNPQTPWDKYKEYMAEHILRRL